MDLYTMIMEFRGGTYCTQVHGNNLREALINWIEKLKIEKNEIKYLGDSNIQLMKTEVLQENNEPTLLSGLKNVWYTFGRTKNGNFHLNIIKTSKI